jgi:hypothetical protein
MRTLKFTFWRPSRDELIENLKDLLTDIESGEVPFIKKVEEMTRSKGRARVGWAANHASLPKLRGFGARTNTS